MGQRSILCTSQMLDLEMGQQGQGHLHPEPYILFGNIFHYPQPNMHPLLSTSGNTTNLNLHHFPGRHDNVVFYGNQFSSLQHYPPATNIDLGVAAPPNYYNPYMIPSSGSRICPAPLNHGFSDQHSSSSNYGVSGIDINENEGNNHFMYGVRSSAKRKNAEVTPWNCHHHVNASASSSSSSSLGITLNSGRHQSEERFESGAGVADSAAFLPPDHLTNEVLSFTGGSGRSVRSRSSTIGLQLDSTLIPTQNHLVQGNYMSQSSQQVSSAWAEQHFVSNDSDGSTSTWNHAPLSYLQGRGGNGVTTEIASMGGQGYPETMISRNPAILFHPSSGQQQQLHHHHPHFHHHPPPLVQAMRGQNCNYQTQAQLYSNRHVMNGTLQHGTFSPSLDSLESGPRYPRSFSVNGLRIYRPNQDGVHQTAAPVNRNRPHLRILSEDEVAILEFPGFYELQNFNDQYRDMRLDIDDMSYEELLALGEHIGNVKTGLLEETILRSLKTRIHFSSGTVNMDHETGTCTICQVEFENQERIGTLDCGHEYHAECIKQWLQVKNLCPVCKMPALTVEDMDE